jgi:hypothetical protein
MQYGAVWASPTDLQLRAAWCVVGQPFVPLWRASSGPLSHHCRLRSLHLFLPDTVDNQNGQGVPSPIASEGVRHLLMHPQVTCGCVASLLECLMFAPGGPLEYIPSCASCEGSRACCTEAVDAAEGDQLLRVTC